MAKPKFRTKQPKKVVPTEKAPEVEALAQDLIERYHSKLGDAKIAYGFTAKKSKLFGKVVLVREEAQTLLERKISFMVIVRKAAWEASDQGRREAALDELLCSMSYDGMQPRIEKPDFRGFRANILRFGVRTDELEHAFRGCQLILPGTDEIEAELAPAPVCEACGDPATGDHVRPIDDKPLCDTCWTWLMGENDPGRSNADDEGAHCEQCNSWGREGRLEETDGRMLCWKCAATPTAEAGDDGLDAEMANAVNKLREGAGEGTTLTLSVPSTGQSVTLTGTGPREAA